VPFCWLNGPIETPKGQLTRYTEAAVENSTRHHIFPNMKFLHSFLSPLLLSGACIVSAASSWSFEDATVSVQSKGAGVGAGAKDK
jgi:hypothetical protein